jgi:stearoyl-CoA desaturase (delta-9 desaturase)
MYMSATETKTAPILWGNATFLTLTPVLALSLAPIYVWFNGFSWGPVIALMVLWIGTGLAITAGYHRLFSHRSYKAPAPIRLLFAILGAATWQNSVISWCSDHRRHHRRVDTDDDPYNAKRGFWWSHIGWVMVESRHYGDYSNVPDLVADPICMWQHNHYMKISIAFNVGVPLMLGLLTGDVWGMLLFAGLVRVVVVHHFTFCINSIAHIWGRQPWGDGNTSRDSWWLSLLTFGEGYHNYHHAFESDYRNGPRWYNVDPSKWLIWALGRMGLATQLRKMPADVVLRRRFEERRAAFSAKLEQLGHRMETWRDEVTERATQRAEHAHTVLQTRLVRAESRLEDALADLRAARSAYVAARRSRRQNTMMYRPSRQEIRSLRSAARSAHRSVKATLAEWEQLMGDWAALPIPATA